MPDRLPLPGWPRVLGETLAAAYLGVSPGTFRAHIMPEVRPLRLSPGRQGWDRLALDAWVDRQPGAVSSAISGAVNEWDVLLGADVEQAMAALAESIGNGPAKKRRRDAGTEV